MKRNTQNRIALPVAALMAFAAITASAKNEHYQQVNLVSDLPGVYDVRIAIDWPTGEYVVKTYQYRQPPIATRR